MTQDIADEDQIALEFAGSGVDHLDVQVLDGPSCDQPSGMTCTIDPGCPETFVRKILSQGRPGQPKLSVPVRMFDPCSG